MLCYLIFDDQEERRLLYPAKGYISLDWAELRQRSANKLSLKVEEDLMYYSSEINFVEELV